MGSEEITKTILIDGVIEAFEEYMDKEPDHEHLLPLEKLRKIPFDLVTHPSAWSAAKDNDNDMVRIAPSRLQESDGDVLLPIYDLKGLPVVERLVGGGKSGLKDTPLGANLLEEPVIGILQSRRTLKLQLALQKLAFYLGEMEQGGLCQWVVIRGEDWELRKTHEDTYLLGDVLVEPSDGVGDGVKDGVDDGDEDGGEKQLS
jgi:hypothetical protein